MHKRFLLLLASLGFLLVIAGCTAKQDGPPKDPKAAAYDFSNEKSFVVYGEGIAPMHTISPAQAIALAKRAAITDGYRQLGEKLYGVKINSSETVQDAALKDSHIAAHVNALLKGAEITDATFKDGLYSIRMEITMSTHRWQELFAY